MNMFRMTEGNQGLKGFLIGSAAVGLPVLAGILLSRERPDAGGLLFVLVDISVGGGVAALWGLRKGPLDVGRAGSMGGVAWVAALLLVCLCFLSEHPRFALGIWVLFILPFAAFGILMGSVAYGLLQSCIRRI
jgi:hypothetical protein